MMSLRASLLSGTTVIILLAGACQEPTRRLNAPPQGASNAPHPMQNDMNYMVDNALLEDMCVSDIHFVPHTTQINSLGARRLNRYAELMLNIGGTIHYDTSERDENLVDARVETVREYLADAGADLSKVEVVPGLPRGRETRATAAIQTMEKSASGDASTSPSTGQSMFP
jgi:hypothetical protein